MKAGPKTARASERTGGSAAPAVNKPDAQQKPKPPPKPKTEPKYFIHSKKVVDGVVIASALFTLGIARWFRPGFWTTIIYAAVGLPIGVALAFLFYMRQKKKAKLRQLVRRVTLRTPAWTRPSCRPCLQPRAPGTAQNRLPVGCVALACGLAAAYVWRAQRAGRSRATVLLAMS